MNLDSLLQNNPNLKNIPPEKLNFLLSFASQNQSGTAKEMASSLMQASKTAHEKNWEFSNDERDLLINLLKQNMTPQEQAKTDQILMLMRRMKR